MKSMKTSFSPKRINRILKIMRDNGKHDKDFYKTSK